MTRTGPALVACVLFLSAGGAGLVAADAPLAADGPRPAANGTANVSVGSYGIGESPLRVWMGDDFLYAQNETVYANATLRNDGSADGSLTVTLYADGVAVNGTNVTVAANATANVTLSTSFASAGPHALTVNDRPTTNVTVCARGSGDLTGNGVVNSLDATRILQDLGHYLSGDPDLGSPPNPAGWETPCGDITGGGFLGSSDVSLILDRAAENPVAVPGSRLPEDPDGATLYLRPSDVTAAPGQRVTVTFGVENINTSAYGFAGYAATIRFDPALLNVTDVSHTDLDEDCLNCMVTYRNGSAGRVGVAQLSPLPPQDRPFPTEKALVNVTFEVEDAAPANASIAFDPAVSGTNSDQVKSDVGG